MITGLYPGDHNIIADQFADTEADDSNGKYFDKANEESTGLPKWWQYNEPIWASASKAGLNFSTFLWSRCDVEWFDVKTEKPSFCENIYRKDESKTLFFNMEIAMIHFQMGITDAAIVSFYFCCWQNWRESECKQKNENSGSVQKRAMELWIFRETYDFDTK